MKTQPITKIMAEALKDINKYVRQNTESVIKHNVAEDGLPKKVKENEDWN